mmetsp:Transcript_23131/g.51003  ORF Transcript_23131/g.51003 Transcript_23131/m.51003 type:complete len:203 (-) Transcript_23131:1533-2141(-)
MNTVPSRTVMCSCSPSTSDHSPSALPSDDLWAVHRTRGTLAPGTNQLPCRTSLTSLSWTPQESSECHTPGLLAVRRRLVNPAPSQVQISWPSASRSTLKESSPFLVGNHHFPTRGSTYREFTMEWPASEVAAATLDSAPLAVLASLCQARSLRFSSAGCLTLTDLFSLAASTALPIAATSSIICSSFFPSCSKHAILANSSS